jgi:pimeloyl-ACP methyl ester carboxylesterase
MKYARVLLAAAGLCLVLVSLLQIRASAQGLQVIPLEGSLPPAVIIAPAGSPPAAHPTVLIGHGFAGSGVVMRGFAFTLAHAGYTTLSWDFAGHGANSQPLPDSTSGGSLLADARNALSAAVERGWVDPRRIAILGHSMGTGVALLYGQQFPDTRATIAVSPVGQPVTSSLPHNLLLMAGSLEPAFAENARQRLAEAGGAGGDPSAGTARRLVIVPGVEHISILFALLAHEEARAWLDVTFGEQPDAAPYTDRRILWYGMEVLGALLAAASGLPLLLSSGQNAKLPGSVRRRIRWLAALLAGALLAVLALWMAARTGLVLSSLLGLLVGGYLIVWFFTAGILAWVLSGQRPEMPSARSLLAGLLVFAFLWLSVGLVGGVIWLPWLLIARRLLLYPLAVLALLPWFSAVGAAGRGMGLVGQAGLWLAHSLVVCTSLYLTLRIQPDLGFLILILPLFPIILGLQTAAGAAYRGGWAAALSGTMFTAWILLAVFPLR